MSQDFFKEQENLPCCFNVLLLTSATSDQGGKMGLGLNFCFYHQSLSIYAKTTV